MTNPLRQVDDSSTPSASPDEYADEVVPLRPLIQLLSTYRRILALAVLMAVALSGALLLGLAVMLPSERTGSIQFRLLFDGAAENRYPNGTTFSPAEIVATPVLSEVYLVNDLKRFGEYRDFKDSMSVLRSNLALDLLAASYQARLADTKLAPVDRARLEDEFRKKREAITDPVYSVAIRRHERLRAMPTALMEKILNDTLATWARQADELKGVTRLNLPVFSQSILKPDILEKDYLMAADGLRVQARRAGDLAQKLMLVPGAASIRSQKDKTSLSDVSFDIADILRNQIDPLVYLIKERGLTSDAQAMEQYLHGRVLDLRLERDATRARVQALQDALQSYMAATSARPREGAAGAGSSGRPAQGLETQTLIPQINDTFLDRLIAMSTQTQARDVEFRQRLTDRVIKEGEALFDLDRSTAYYEGLVKTGRTGNATSGQGAAARTQLRGAYDALVAAINRLMTLYEEVSAQRLNPTTMLYAVSDPFTTRTQYALTSGTVFLVLTLAVLMALLLTPIGCAIHQAYVRKARAARAS
jgi:hypothetical protein